MEQKKYSQNNEDLHIVNYFNGKTGTLLSIGENDGKTFSNSLALIDLGWRALLVEPSPKAFEKLIKLHKENNSNAICVNVAIGDSVKKVTLHESGHHLKDKSDLALLSSVVDNETIKWKKSGVEFTEVEVDMVDYKTLCEITEMNYFDFITIDCEGLDVSILKQIDLTNTKLVCIEYNCDQEAKKEIIDYCSKFGIENIIYVTGENLLIGR